MKKLIYLFLTVLIVACSSEDGGNDNNDGNNNNDIACEYVLNTLPVTNTIYDSATFNGIISIDSNCEFPITEQGFVYATTIQPTLNDNQVNANGTDVTSTIENLEPDTTYYVRTFLTNALGEFYGNEVSFLTTEEPCDVVYLADNGITIKACEDANVGDTGVINGITYTVVDEAMLRAMVDNEDDVTTVITTKVTNMDRVVGDFDTGSDFNQDISSWDVSNVTTMEYMFFNAEVFNQNISSWDVSNVTKMRYMFFNAEVFNQPIGNWDVSSVYDMERMFRYATSYNQDLSSWSVDGVAQCLQFSDNTPSWTLPQPNFTNCTP